MSRWTFAGGESEGSKAKLDDSCGFASEAQSDDDGEYSV